MQFEVYYAKDIFSYALDQPVVLETLSDTHVLVRTVEAESLGQVYNMMQADRWKEVTPAYILGLGLGHTSLSVGDVIKDGQGQYWQCLNRGWRIIGELEHGSQQG